MDFSQFLQELGVYGHLTALLLGMPRLFALVTVAPFLGSAVVTGQIRLMLVLALYLPLHPVIVSHLTDEITLSAALSLAVGGKLALLLLKEAVLGLMIGFLAGIVFWTVQSAGFSWTTSDAGPAWLKERTSFPATRAALWASCCPRAWSTFFIPPGRSRPSWGWCTPLRHLAGDAAPAPGASQERPVFCGKGRLAQQYMLLLA